MDDEHAGARWGGDREIPDAHRTSPFDRPPHDPDCFNKEFADRTEILNSKMRFFFEFSKSTLPAH